MSLHIFLRLSTKNFAPVAVVKVPAVTKVKVPVVIKSPLEKRQYRMVRARDGAGQLRWELRFRGAGKRQKYWGSRWRDRTSSTIGSVLRKGGLDDMSSLTANPS